jgi:molybdopterin-guanine dinucleotide biosynthesis protein A
MTAPLYGLVLAGGRSRRMGRDKAALEYHGEPHVRRTAALLSQVCERVFVSRRADQANETLFEGYETIPDAFDMGGPLNGILSALSAHPGAAFLVAACDLPFLSEEALRVLVASRDPSKPMTVFENPARENFPEPLCAIYEPSYEIEARAAMARGATCPTKIAQAVDAKRLALRGPEEALFLENANTPEDHARASGALAPASVVTVEYFALFRERAKRASEEVSLDGSSLADLYERLRERHGFALERASVLVAINDAYASWDAVPQSGDRLAFIPPVSGG